MSTATALSRITGFVRMWVTALALAVSGLASSYFVSNNIPNMIYELVAGGILSALFIPTFMQVRAEHGDQDSWRFASHVLNLAVVALGIVALLGTVWPGPFIWTQTFRMPAEQAVEVRTSAEYFFRFFAIQVVVYGAGMVVQGLLNAQRKYLWTALGPVFNNLVVIATMLAYAAIFPRNPDTALLVLAAGTTLGVVAMFAVMVPDLARSGFHYRFELGLDDPRVRRMLRLAAPTVVYVATNLIAVSFRNASALAVTEDGPSALMYAWTFYQLPYGILAVALATAVFTELADAASRSDMTALRQHFTRGLSATGVLMLPAAGMLIALAEPLISLYRVGQFQASDIPVVVPVLRWWAAGLVFFAGTMFVLRTFYALQDTKTPMTANLMLTPVQIGGYLLLSTGIAGWPGLGLKGIAIADGVFYAAILVTLGLLLRRRIGDLALRGVVRTYSAMLLASGLGSTVAWFTALALAPEHPAFIPALIQVSVAGTIGLAVAFGAARLVRVPEMDVVTSLVHRVSGRLSKRRRGDS